MKSNVREPRQERSIEKKNKIIQAGYEIFSEVGYHGATTVDIAKRAGVSTGIVYGYFEDKRDIMICVLQIYINNVCKPVFDIIRGAENSFDINKIVPAVIDAVIKAHEGNAKLHNTLHSLAASDEAVNAKFISLENDITEAFSSHLVKAGVSPLDIKEKVHLAMNVIQSFAHEYVFDKHPYINYTDMRAVVCNILASMFLN